MKRPVFRNFLVSCIFLSSVLGLYSCGGEDVIPCAGEENGCSFASTVIDVTTSNPQTCSVVDLDGSGSSGSNLTYTWTLTSQPEGSTAVLVSANTATTSFIPLVSNPPNDNTYSVNLTVKDDQGNQNSTQVSVQVAKLPVADPGNYSSGFTPGTDLPLDGSESKNPEADIPCANHGLTYTWTVTQGTPTINSCGISNPGPSTDPKAAALVTLSDATACSVQLTVTTASGLSATNSVTIPRASQ